MGSGRSRTNVRVAPPDRRTWAVKCVRLDQRHVVDEEAQDAEVALTGIDARILPDLR